MPISKKKTMAYANVLLNIISFLHKKISYANFMAYEMNNLMHFFNSFRILTPDKMGILL